MGAIWAARDLCLFLLLLNSHQSRALPEIRGGTVVSVCACMRVCVSVGVVFSGRYFTLRFLECARVNFLTA